MIDIEPTHIVLIIAVLVGCVLLAWFISPKKEKIEKVKSEKDLFEIMSPHVVFCKICRTPLNVANRDTHVMKKHKELSK